MNPKIQFEKNTCSFPVFFLLSKTPIQLLMTLNELVSCFYIFPVLYNSDF